jgi:hypothetical protein
MHRHWFVVVGALAWSAAGLIACGDDTEVAPVDAGPDASLESDSGGFETGAFDSSALPDASTGADAEAGQPPPARLLLSYNATTQSELDVFGLQSQGVDGRLVYPGFIGTTATTGSSPWLLEQASDLVARLDPIQPWIMRSSWNVALHDATDAGFAAPYSDPDGIVVGAGTQAYVLRYTRNLIAVLDTTQDVDGGAPSSTIDLSGQVQAGGDGYVEMSAGYFDPATSKTYVLLGNIDRFNVASDGYTQLCSNTHPTLVAIDTATNAVVAPPVGDAGTSGFALQGYDPAFGPSAMVYDPANNRLLVLESGCSTAGTDGGVGPVTRRGVEAVSLTTGAVTQLLDLSSQAFPQAIFYVDQHHVVLQLDTAYMWDPSTTTLGPAIPNAPQAFALDAKGNLVGLNQQVSTDGGPGGWNVVSVNATDGGVTTLGQNPFSLSNGFVGGVQLWPSP